MKMNTLVGELLKGGLLSAIIAVAAPDLVSAQDDINQLITDVASKQLPAFPYVLSAVCYVGGSFLMVSGALSLKKHAENPTGEAMSKGIARLLTGGAITAVPALTGVIQKSTMLEGNKASFDSFNVTF